MKSLQTRSCSRFNCCCRSATTCGGGGGDGARTVDLRFLADPVDLVLPRFPRLAGVCIEELPPLESEPRRVVTVRFQAWLDVEAADGEAADGEAAGGVAGTSPGDESAAGAGRAHRLYGDADGIAADMINFAGRDDGRVGL